MSVVSSYDKEFTLHKNDNSHYVLHLDSNNTVIHFDWLKTKVQANSKAEALTFQLMRNGERNVRIDLRKMNNMKDRFEITIMMEDIYSTITKEESYIRYLMKFLQEHVKTEDIKESSKQERKEHFEAIYH